MRWLEHVLRVRDHRLPWQAILCAVGVGCKKFRGCQTKTWHQSMKLLTIGLSHIDKYRICGWVLRDYHYQWLLYYMAQNRLQWHMCSHSMSSSNFWGLYFANWYFLFKKYLRSPIFPLTTDTIDTSSILRFDQTISRVLSSYGNLTRLIFLQVLF